MNLKKFTIRKCFLLSRVKIKKLILLMCTIVSFFPFGYAELKSLFSRKRRKNPENVTFEKNIFFYLLDKNIYCNTSSTLNRPNKV